MNNEVNWEKMVGTRVTVSADKYGYKIGGVSFKRVTGILKGIPKPALVNWAAKQVAAYAVAHRDAWKDLPLEDARKLLAGAPWSKRDAAGDRGTAVHQAVEAYLGRGELSADLTEGELNCAISVEAFLRAKVAQVYETEVTVFSPLLGYAGTLDLWYRDNVQRGAIADWKTGKDVYPDYVVQQIAYHRAQYALVNRSSVKSDKGETWTGELVPWGPAKAEALGIVHVQEHCAVWREIPRGCWERAWQAFLSAREISAWMSDTDGYAGRQPRMVVYAEAEEIKPEDQAAPVPGSAKGA